MKNTKLDENEKELKLFLLFVLILTILIFGYIYWLQLNKQPETFSETYLGKMEKEAKVNKEFNVQFIIENKERKPMNYNYSISIEEKEIEKKVSLQENEKKTINEKIIFTKASEEKRVLIEVKKDENNSKELSLWFWVKVNEN